jgi:hypothetical protein
MWHEVIHLRVVAQDLEEILPTLRHLIEEIREKENCGKVELFRRARVETDVCLHLYHESGLEPAGGSKVGVRLAASLKSYGMVNHTVWLADEQA